MKKLYYITIFFCFTAVTLAFALYVNCFCMSSDDIWIMDKACNAFFDADHGSFIPVKIHTLINRILPVFFGIHPQFAVSRINIYFYGFIYALTAYFMTKGAFLFSKNKYSFPLYFIIISVLFFGIAMLIESMQYGYWMKEACTYTRFTFSLLTLLIAMNIIFKSVLLKNIANKKQLFAIFLASVAAGNTSEFCSFVGVIFLTAYIVYLYLNKTPVYNKTIKFLYSSLAGFIVGTVLIILNPTFQEVTFQSNRVGFLYDYKHFSVFSDKFISQLFIPDTIFLILFLTALLIIGKLYVKKIFKNVAVLSFLLFSVSNAFYLFLYYFSADVNEMDHGDLKLLLIGCLIFELTFLFGLILRKIKDLRIVSIINIFLISCFSMIIYKNFNAISLEVKTIREHNLKEREYINFLEDSFLKQYRIENSRKIILKSDELIPRMYTDYYFYRFMPVIYKDIEKDSYEIEWIEE